MFTSTPSFPSTPISNYPVFHREDIGGNSVLAFGVLAMIAVVAIMMVVSFFAEKYGLLDQWRPALLLLFVPLGVLLLAGAAACWVGAIQVGSSLDHQSHRVASFVNANLDTHISDRDGRLLFDGQWISTKHDGEVTHVSLTPTVNGVQHLVTSPDQPATP